MPYIYPSSYQPPRWVRGRQHLQTIVPSLFRKIKDVVYQRQRIEISDGDFLDLDWSKTSRESSTKSKKLIILSHGLEGSSDRPYITGMVSIFNKAGYDALGWNMRSCGGEPNRLPRFYHHGATEDLNAVVEYVLQHTDYKEIILIGFSLGGNMTLKYLGEKGENVSPKIKKAVAFSVPCDLPSSVPLLRTKGFSKYYANRFKNKLVEKIKLKKEILGAAFVDNLLPKIKILDDLTDLFFAEVHGFANSEDYYRLNSSGPYLKHIRIPTLIVNAKNDPMLSDECSDVVLAKSSPYIFLEIPAEGGHCGFAPKTGGTVYWSEQRALAFCEEV